MSKFRVSVKFERKATGIPDGVGVALLAGHRRETGELRVRLPTSDKSRAGEPGDVLGDLEEPVSAAALGMDDPLGHPLPVEMLHLLNDIVVVPAVVPLGPTVNEYSSLCAGIPESVVVVGGRVSPMVPSKPAGGEHATSSD